MALLLREADVRSLLTMDRCIDALDSLFRQQADGECDNQPRRRVSVGGARLNAMFAALPKEQAMGAKVYGVSRSGAAFVVLLFDGNGNLQALIEANALGQIRTGAASGVATKALARADAHVLAVIGAGFQARTQIEAVASVRGLTEIRIYGRTAERAQKLAEEMGGQLNVDARPATSVEDAVRGADIVVTATNAKEPVLAGTLLEPGMHLNVMGSNIPTHREIDDVAVRRAAVIAVDQLKTAMLEAGDLLPLIERGQLHWDEVSELGEIVAGRRSGRVSGKDITIFKSHGIAAEDVVAAKLCVELARERGVGETLDFAAGR